MSQSNTFKHPLKVSSNKRYLVDQNGKPAFLLADTKWQIFAYPGKNDILHYLDVRKSQKFNALLVTFLPWGKPNERYGVNPNGEPPFENRDMKKPNEKYWQYVDDILKECSDRGFTVFIVVAWQRNWKDAVNKSGAASSYGAFIGERYKSYKNKIYLMGGDDAPGNKEKKSYDTMAKAIKSKDNSVLISYHPAGNGHSSSESFKSNSWMDFHSVQTTNSSNKNYTLIDKDYRLSSPKPTWIVEPGYENAKGVLPQPQYGL